MPAGLEPAPMDLDSSTRHTTVGRQLANTLETMFPLDLDNSSVSMLCAWLEKAADMNRLGAASHTIVKRERGWKVVRDGVGIMGYWDMMLYDGTKHRALEYINYVDLI
jgi:hypothetical protein